MKSFSRTLRPSLTILTVIACSILLWGCKGGGSLYDKLTPETRLSNVPPDGITSPNPRLSLSWVGDDADGYVVAYKYRWNFRLTAADTFQYKPWTAIMNITQKNLALVLVPNPQVPYEVEAPKVYRYFATLPPEGLDTARVEALAAGDTILIEGARLFASNPDEVRYPTHTGPSGGTFIFDSQDILNPHTFEIAAIDNDGLVDPSPAALTFTTPQVLPPATEILAAPSDTVLVLDYTTDTFEGIPFSFQGIDKNSRTLDYQWVVDKEIWLERTGRIPWSEFSPNTTARVTAADFPDPFAATHTFYVRARNEFGSIDTLGFFTRTRGEAGGGTVIDTFYANRVFHTVYPAFKQPGYTPRTLLINNSYDFDTSAIAPTRPNYAMLEQYYREVYTALGKTEGVDYDFWRVKSQGFPGRGTLGNYNKVHFIGDIVSLTFLKWSRDAGTELALLAAREATLTDYCYIGGKLIMNGWNLPRPDQMSPSPNFFRTILHIQLVDQRDLIGDLRNGVFFEYIGAKGDATAGYPDAPIDQAKLDTLFGGGLPSQWVFSLSGFGEIIQRCGPTRSNLPGFEGKPIGVRYLGVTYDVFLLGYPLYFTEQSAAIETLRKIYQEFDSPR